MIFIFDFMFYLMNFCTQNSCRATCCTNANCLDAFLFSLFVLHLSIRYRQAKVENFFYYQNIPFCFLLVLRGIFFRENIVKYLIVRNLRLLLVSMYICVQKLFLTIVADKFCCIFCLLTTFGSDSISVLH